MIQYIKRKNLHTDKYNECISQSPASKISGYSWYLDLACTAWDALVYGDYQAVMPIPHRSKYGINYVYIPEWLLQLGIFSKNPAISPDDFIPFLFKKFKYAEIRLNTHNQLPKHQNLLIDRQMQVIPLDATYTEIHQNYNRNRKRDVKKAFKNQLREHWGDHPQALLSLYQNNVGKRLPKINAQDYHRLLQIMQHCIANQQGEILSIYDSKNQLVAAAFFMFHQNYVTELVCASDFSNRNNGGHTFFNDRALFKYQPHFDVFDFGGSSMEAIARYYHSFGAIDEHYYILKYNHLPAPIRWVKK